MPPAKKKTRAKRTAKKPLKKSSTKKRQSNNHRSGFLLRLVIVLFVAAIAAVLLLDAWVVAKFSGKKWAMPAQVYARPLELYVGKKLSADDLVAELKALGYRANGAVRPGSFSIEGNAFRIYSRGFSFTDGYEPARRFSLMIKRDQLVWLQDSEDQADLIRLEPIQIGGIYPAHKEDRLLLKLEDVPQSLIDALLLIEDGDFYQHWGVSPKGIARAVWVNTRAGRIQQGGSTLTQQLVKNFFLTNQRSLSRKAIEAVVALMLEFHFSKDEILEAYLNEVYLGQSGARAIHGFGLASQYYFNRPIQQLSLSQVALLVGLVKGPSYYDPWRHSGRALKRRNLVLDEMRDHQLASVPATNLAKLAPLQIGGKDAKHRVSYPAYLDLVKRQLRKGYNERDLSSQGLKIFTSFDPLAQWRLERSSKSGLERLRKTHGPDIDEIEMAALVTSVESGDVIAAVGGRQMRYAGFNRVLDAKRSVGSLIKPAVYLTALSTPSQYTLATMLDDAAIEIPGKNGTVWKPQNFSRKVYGPVPLHQALAKSYNLSTVNLGMDLGLHNVADTISALGVEGKISANPSMLLGTTELTMFDVASMYQTLAAGGFHSPLNTIRAVSDHEGNLIKPYPLEFDSRIDERATYLIRYAMQEVMREGTGRYAYQYLDKRVAIAGKTGTSGKQRDSWFAGFDGRQLAVVWLGRDDNESTPLTGSSGALRLWTEYMRSGSLESLAQSPPDGIEFHWADNQSNALSRKSCQGAIYMPFITGSEPDIMAPCVGASNAWHWFLDLMR